MEPLSAFVLASTFFVAPATRRPTWELTSEMLLQSESRLGDSTQFLLEIPANIASPATKWGATESAIGQQLSPRELLMREVLSYPDCEDDWNGEGTLGPSQHAVDAATAFINAIPARLPLPRPMLSADGEIGLYWALGGGYAEVTFNASGEIVFFSRSNNGVERYDDQLNVALLNDAWFWAELGPIDSVAQAA